MRKCLFSVENPFKDCGVNILKVKGVIFTYIFKKYIFLDHYFTMIGQIRADRKRRRGGGLGKGKVLGTS